MLILMLLMYNLSVSPKLLLLTLFKNLMFFYKLSIGATAPPT